MSRPVETGRVYIVGAGPGDPELLTLRAAAILRRADAVFHDELISPEVLDMASPGAELIPAGHRAGLRKRDRRAIAAEMALRARRGEVVCRLKGGDPFVFGRGGEDLETLVTEQGVACEVVPGVSSAIAGPAAAGVAVTHRGLARSVLIVTGHQKDPEETLDWERLRADTVVVLMAGTRLRQVTGAMRSAGWPSDTPAMVISRATTPQQRHVAAPLEAIADRAEAVRLAAPALLVVGRVVDLAARLVLAAGAAAVP